MSNSDRQEDEMLAASIDTALPPEKKTLRFQVGFWHSAQQLLNKRKVEAQLRRLRDQHRLAIHMCERQGIYGFPDFSWGCLAAAPACEIPARMFSGEMPLISASLLPAARTRRSMLPCIVESGQPGDYAYLIDLSQDIQDAARVVYASHTDLQASGEPVGRKYWGKHIERTSFNKALKDIFEHFASQEEWEKAVTSEKGAELAAEQLKVISGLHAAKIEPADGNIVPHNELLVAASQEHVRAICIPYFIKRPQDEAWYTPLEQLAGALAGLQHLDEGIDLPVVLYQVNAPYAGSRHNVKQGDFEYLGQGRSGLLEKAFAAIASLQEHDSIEELNLSRRYTIADVLKFETFSALGIDVSKPLIEQAAKMRQLRAQCESEQ